MSAEGGAAAALLASRDDALRGLRSLRARAIAVVVLVVLSPLAFVLVSNGVESIFARRTAGLAAAAAEAAASALGAEVIAGDDREAAIDAVAASYGQRIRVVGLPDGAVIYDRDHGASSRWLDRLGDVVYGPGRADALSWLDASRGPILDRPEARDAARRDEGETCQHVARGNLEVCSAARRARFGGGAAIVYAQGSSRRALQTLYDARRDLVKLTLFVLALGVALGAWMGRRVVLPIERLRAEVLARARAAVPRADLPVARRDEVGDLAVAFNALAAALADRARANEASFADLAHELKSPIASVRACADHLEGGAPDAARARRLAGSLRASSLRLDALVTQFLELARAESGLPDERREPIDVAELARGVARAFALDGRAPAIAVTEASAGKPARVAGVPSRIESVLRNLLDNALAFSDASGAVTVAIREADDGVEIAVGDRGSGIAAADLPRVFDRFFTTRRDRRGTGLGLALTRAIVEAHGGRIHAESTPGEGARFVVHLPRAP